MKRIHTIVMVGLLTAVMMTMAGCKKEQGKVTLGATIESSRNAKVYIDKATPCWHNGDLLRINNQTCTTSAALGSSAQITDVDANEGYRALYPSNLLANVDADITEGGNIAIELPRVQTYEFDGIDQMVKVPMGAFSTSTSLTFRNLCSLIKVVISSRMDAPFRLDSIGVDATVAFLSGEGTARIEGGENDEVTMNENAKHSVSLAFPVSEAPEISQGPRNTYVYYIIAPKFDRNDVTIRLYADNGRYAMFEKRDVALRANSIATVSLTVEELEQGYVDPISMGILPGEFSVAEGRKVHFSKGNLQYSNAGQHAVAGGIAYGTWRFADHQYDYVGSDNANIGENNTGWIDLFGRATSGWNSGCVSYKPYATSYDASDYFTNDMTGTNANADWGVYNAIENGGNNPGMWRTLTKAEWNYLFRSRVDAQNKYGEAVVAGVNGVIILPDGWTMPLDRDFRSGFGTSWSQNVFSAAEWQQMEASGAVFLPAAGYRNGTNVYNVGAVGSYWSVTRDGDILSYIMNFDETRFFSVNSTHPSEGCSVRLVTVETAK